MKNANLVQESVEQALLSAIGNVKRFADESLDRTEACIRESPEKTIACSVGIGYLLSFLPIDTFIVLIVRLMLRLIRPVLFLLGLAKVCELAAAGCKSFSNTRA
jgi:hypothetical protein